MNLLTPLDFSTEQIYALFKKTAYLKKHPYGVALKNKSLAMIFQKPSTRTRVSFEVGMTQLGGHAVYLNTTDLQLSRGETIADTARVLASYVDAIMARVNNHKDLEEIAQNAGVPVVNGLSDIHHPCQAFADLFTLWETWGTLKNKKISFVGDGDNNVTNSLLVLSARLGINFTIASPKKYQPKKEIILLALTEAKISGSTVTIVDNPIAAVKNAGAVVTDTWVSMGRTDEKERLRAFAPYQVNKKLVSFAPNSFVLHCLPAHRGQEITDDVIDGKQSLVWQEAQNRLHVQKALLLFLLS